MVELRKLQGAWTNDEQESMEVRISKAGDLTLGGLSWDEQTGRFRAENLKLYSTQAGNLSFLCMASADESSKDEYFFPLRTC